MKKLIAISITLVLAASAAFAQVTVGGQARGGWTPLKGDNRDGTDVTDAFAWAGRLQVSYATEDKVFGGTVRVYSAPGGGWHADDFAWAWWQPIQQVKFSLGRNPDGEFGVHDFTGWGFWADAGDVSVASGPFSGSAFYDGFGVAGAWLTLAPIDGLAVNLAVPGNNRKAAEDFKRLHAQITYNIADIGRIAVTYKGGFAYTTPQSTDKDKPAYYDPTSDYGKYYGVGATSILGLEAGSIYASFLLSAVENLGLNIGAKYSLPVTEEKVTYSAPVEIGLGANYGAGDFGVSARLNFAFAGNVKPDGQDATPVPFNFQLNVMPYYDLGILKAFLNLGMDLVTDQENSAGANISELHLGWYVNPYICKAVGGGEFFAGFRLAGVPAVDPASASKAVYTWKTDIEWGIPVGLVFNF